MNDQLCFFQLGAEGLTSLPRYGEDSARAANDSLQKELLHGSDVMRVGGNHQE